MAARKTTHRPPHRVRLTVPHDDDVTMAWLDAQVSASSSIRMLIREAMMAHGPIDALSRPLEVRVPRSAPAQHSGEEVTDLADGRSLAEAARRRRSRPAPVRDPEPVQADPAPEDDDDDDELVEDVEDALAQEQSAAQDGPRPQEFSPAVPQEPSSAAAGSGLSEVGDFFSTNRD